MTRVEGIPVQGGVSVGPIRFFEQAKHLAHSISNLSPREELVRFEAAKARATAELKRLQAFVAAHLGDNESAIFLFQSMLLEDADYLDLVYSCINDSATAEYAVAQAERQIVSFFLSLDDSYLQERHADAKDLSQRLGTILSDTSQSYKTERSPVILAGEDLAPSLTAYLGKRRLLGLVSHHGSANSHTAILARATGIPAVTGIKVDASWDGHVAILDGDTGVLTVDPDEQTLRRACVTAMTQPGVSVLPEILLPQRAFDHTPARLCATIGSAWEAADAYSEGANGIGLFYTSVLHSERDTPPSEAEQLDEYSQAALAMKGRPVFIQSLGLDETRRPGILDNLLHRHDLLRTQFRAVLRAAAQGNVSLAVPKPASVWEFNTYRQELKRCEQELSSEGTAFRCVKVGAYIRSPRILLSVDSLVDQTDFLVLDGQSLLDASVPRSDARGTPNYLAFTEMVRLAIKSAHQSGQRLMMTGKWQNYLQAVLPLQRLGVDDFSAEVPALPLLRELCVSAGRPAISDSHES